MQEKRGEKKVELLLPIIILVVALAIFVFAAPNPTINSIILNSTLGTNLTNENLTVYVDSTNSTKLIYNWFLNNKPFEILVLPFENNNTFDYSGIGRTSLAVGNVSWRSVGGYKSDGCYRFNGGKSDVDYISFTTKPTLGSNRFTINLFAVWRGDTDTNSYQYVYFEPTGAPGYNSPAIRLSSGAGGTVQFIVSSTTGAVIATSTNVIDLDVWYMITGVFNGTNVMLYLNGVLNNTASFSGIKSEPTNNLIIGRFDTTANSATSYEFNGSIDEIRVFNKSLSSAQILALYNNANNNTVIVSNELNVGDVWTARVTPINGTDNGISVNSTPLTIASGIPSISGSVILTSANDNFSSGDLNCSFTISDADGGTMSANYTWYKNGLANLTGNVSITVGTLKSLILNSSNLSVTDTWLCQITPYDGTTWGISVNSSSLYIRRQWCNNNFSEYQGNWEVLGTSVCSNEIIFLHDAILNITGNLTLENTTFIFNNTKSGKIGLNSLQGSSLIINHSIINSTNKNVKYFFNIYGNLILKNSDIDRTYYNGLFLNSNNNLIYNNTFVNSKGFGIYLKNSRGNNLSSNKIILDNTYKYGIFLSNSSTNIIENNNITTKLTTKEEYLENLPHLRFGCNFSSFTDVSSNHAILLSNSSLSISSTNGDYGKYAVFNRTDYVSFNISTFLEETGNNFSNFTIVFAVSGLAPTNDYEKIVSIGDTYYPISLRSNTADSLNSLLFSFYNTSSTEKQFIKSLKFDSSYQSHWGGDKQPV